MPEWKGRVPLTRSHCERITPGLAFDSDPSHTLDPDPRPVTDSDTAAGMIAFESCIGLLVDEARDPSRRPSITGVRRGPASAPPLLRKQALLDLASAVAI
ncbi:hypothetical protein EVAR_103094_1 [Eumeta japonica]|uniref:Uncharacterized protein n=1 Tax=Eumeta variegata TaxID=151549 RepID=A0A4C1WQP7_EUMVA|nr:hypothetical protein EVAR_103094_1 [Eumeta japonica]